MEIVFFALAADGDELLIEPIVLKKTGLAEHPAHVLDSKQIDQFSEFFLFQDLKLNIHFAELANGLHLFFFDAIDNSLHVQVLLGEIVPVHRYSFAGVKGLFVSEHQVRSCEQFLFLETALLQLHLLYLLFLLDLPTLEVAFILFIFVEEGTVVLPEVLFRKDVVQVVDYPGLIEKHEVVLHCVQTEIGLRLCYLQVFLGFAQFLTNGVGLLLLIQLQLHSQEADHYREDLDDNPDENEEGVGDRVVEGQIADVDHRDGAYQSELHADSDYSDDEVELGRKCKFLVLPIFLPYLFGVGEDIVHPSEFDPHKLEVIESDGLLYPESLVLLEELDEEHDGVEFNWGDGDEEQSGKNQGVLGDHEDGGNFDVLLSIVHEDSQHRIEEDAANQRHCQHGVGKGFLVLGLVVPNDNVILKEVIEDPRNLVVFLGGLQSAAEGVDGYFQEDFNDVEGEVFGDVEVDEFVIVRIFEDQVAGEQLQAEHECADEDMGLYEVAFEEMQQNLVEEGKDEQKQSSHVAPFRVNGEKDEQGVNQSYQEAIEYIPTMANLVLL